MEVFFPEASLCLSHWKFCGNTLSIITHVIIVKTGTNCLPKMWLMVFQLSIRLMTFEWKW